LAAIKAHVKKGPHLKISDFLIKYKSKVGFT
jgi:hypothetical protein